MGDNFNALISSLDLGSGKIRVVVKDCIDVAGTVTSMGTAALADQPPAQRNAAVVERLLAAPMRIVGKANMHPLAYGVTGQNDWVGTPRNPLYPDRICGGSSSGSAVAVAAGIADIAVGTDTGGSVRMPAACCGIFGLKPSFARISRCGVLPRGSSLDCVGPLARNVDLIETAMAALDKDYRSVKAPRLVSLGRVAVDCADEVDVAMDACLAHADFAVTTVRLPLLEAAHRAGLTIIGREVWEAYGHLVDDPLIPNDVAVRLRRASAIMDCELAEAEDIRIAFTASVDALLEQHSALLMPTMPSPAPLLANATDPAGIVDHTRFLRPFNLSGHPALSIPMEAIDGAPVGLQFIGRRGEDALLCAIAREFERTAQTVTPEEIML